MLSQPAKALLLPSVLTPWVLQQHILFVHALSKLLLWPRRAFSSLGTPCWPVCCDGVRLRSPSAHWMALCFALSGCGTGRKAVPGTRSSFADEPKRQVIVDCCLMQICNPTSLFAGMFVLRSYTSPYRVLSVRLSTACCWSHVFSITHFERHFEFGI